MYEDEEKERNIYIIHTNACPSFKMDLKKLFDKMKMKKKTKIVINSMVEKLSRNIHSIKYLKK